jgi:hypothetical protein
MSFDYLISFLMAPRGAHVQLMIEDGAIRVI